MKQSTHLVYYDKLYTLAEPVWHKLHNNFYLREDWESPKGYYGIKVYGSGNAWLWCEPGLRWDGASLYPDYEFMMLPSLVHDCLHWAIMHGAIPEAMNDLIDKELGDCVRYGTARIPWWKGGELTRRWQARKVQTATHLCNQKRLNRPEHPVKRIEI